MDLGVFTLGVVIGLIFAIIALFFYVGNALTKFGK
jgi:hypothetical protein